MIGWRADIGYSNGLPTKLSDIIITDKNKYWTIPTGTPGIRMSQQRKEATETFENLKSVLGDDVYKIYTVPSRNVLDLQEGVDKLSIAFPSFTLLYPVIWGLGSFSSSQYACYVVYELKCVIVLYSTQDAYSSMIAYRINSDNTLLEIYRYVNNPYQLTLAMDQSFGTTSIEVNGAYFDNSLSITYENLTSKNFYAYSFFWLSNYGDKGYGTTTLAQNVNFVHVDELFKAIFNNGSNYIPPDITTDIPPDNPYEPGGPSGPTDPDLPPGTFDDKSDPIPDSPLPTISAANTGFTRIYNPTLSQVQALARYLWTDDSVIETIWNHIKQFFENPMEAIIGFNLVPVPVPDGGTENFALMYIDTGVSMTVAANQFVDLDCGTLDLERYYGSALDQSPYTKVSCFLPYIGTVNLNTDEVMGTTLQVKYRVDIVSGSCVAKIFVDGNCLYQYSGHCAITIPISSADFSSYVSAAISVGKLAAAAITAGAGAAMAAGVAEASQQTNQVVTTTQVTNTARNPSTGRQITTGTTTTVQTRESPADQSSTQASFSGLSPQNVANTVGAIMSSKPHIEHSGSFSGNSGYLGVRRPFLIIERPNMCMPANYQALNGFPAMITMELSTCKGFTRVQQVQLTGMGRATNPEQAEILELLKSGVIL